MTTVERQVAASADDWFDNSVAWSNVATTWRPFDKDQWVISGARWINITVPKGASIIHAYLQIHCQENKAPSNAIVRIKGFDEDDHSQIVSRADYEGRDKTTAYADWNLNFTTYLCTWYGKTVGAIDIKDIIQEIVNRSGWASGNALGILVNTEKNQTGDYDNKHDSYDSSPDEAPKLEITYLVPIAHEVTITESLGMLDSVPAPKGAFKIAVPIESLGMVDSVARVKGLKQTVTEKLGMLDTIKAPGRVELEISDSLGMVDSTPTKAAFHLSVADSLGMLDFVLLRADLKQAIEDVLGLSDVVGTKAAFKQAASDVLGMLDSAARSKGVHITVSEILGLRDSILYIVNPKYLAKLIRKYIQLESLGGE